MKAKFVNEDIKDIFKPKNKYDIMADLLETDKKNIPMLIKIYDDWYSIFYDLSNDKINIYDGSLDEKKISYVYNDIYHNNILKFFPHVESSGLLGLSRNLERWNERMYSTENMMSSIVDWINWIRDGLMEFEYKTKNPF